MASERLVHAINTLDFELGKVGGYEEYALFGSASLAVRGIISREPGDVDVLVTKRVWGQLLPRPGWHYLTPHAGDPPILARDLYPGMPGHLFYAWRDDHIAIDVKANLARAQLVWWPDLGIKIRCCTVEDVVAHKLQALAWPREEWEARGLVGKMARHQADIDAALLARATNGYP